MRSVGCRVEIPDDPLGYSPTLLLHQAKHASRKLELKMQSHLFRFFFRFIFYQSSHTQRAIWKKTVEGNQVQSPDIVFSDSDTIVVVYLNKTTLSERAVQQCLTLLLRHLLARTSVTKRHTNFYNFN